MCWLATTTYPGLLLGVRCLDDTIYAPGMARRPRIGLSFIFHTVRDKVSTGSFSCRGPYNQALPYTRHSSNLRKDASAPSRYPLQLFLWESLKRSRWVY
jgi:hypothetical protein